MKIVLVKDKFIIREGRANFFNDLIHQVFKLVSI